MTVISAEVEQAARVDDYLGPAMVIETDAPGLRVELPSGAVTAADPAFVIPYAPAVGDMLLVIARGPACYAIGVLHGTGRTVLSLPGDVELRAETGTLRLWGEKGIELSGPAIAVHAEKLRVVADAVTEHMTSLVQRVRGLLSLRAGESHTVVDESAVTKAKRATVLTEETMTINGQQIHLG